MLSDEEILKRMAGEGLGQPQSPDGPEPLAATVEANPLSPLSDEEIIARMGGVQSSKDESKLLPLGDRIENRRQQRIQNTIESFEDYTATNARQTFNPQAGFNKRDLSAIGLTTQVVGQSAGFAADVLGELMVSGAKTLWDLVPDDVQEMASENLKRLLMTDTGKTILEGIATGGEVYDKLKQDFPQEVKTLESGLNVLTMGAGRVARSTGKTAPLAVVTTVRDANGNVTRVAAGNPNGIPLNKVGLRVSQEPLKGIDKDLFDFIFDPKVDYKRTGPQGVLRKQEHLASQTDLDMIDALKRTKVTGADTKVEALNKVEGRIKSLSNAVDAELARIDLAYTPSEVRNALQQSLEELMPQRPMAFKSQTEVGASGVVRDMMNQVDVLIKKHGTSALGLHKIRQEFDAIFKKDIEKAAAAGGEQSMAAAQEAAMRIRRTLNDGVDSLAGNVSTSRRELKNLIEARGIMTPKARQEGVTILQRGLERWGLHNASTPMSAAINAPLTVIAGVVGSFMNGTKLITKNAISAELRAKTGYTLRDIRSELARTASKIKTKEGRAELNAELKVLNALIMEEEQAEEQN